MSLPPRPMYRGDTQKLLLAFDIGTTFSGISYSILDPGKEHVGGDSKIPTVIYYDEGGKPCAIGAETLKEGIEADAEENNWNKAYWFKLHLCPKSKATMTDRNEIPPLPPNKTVIQVFTDYMRYLHRCAKCYISETHGAMLWESLEDEILYALTHPNGWEGSQQASMRSAAIHAGFIPDTTEGRSRISFVTEGEASLRFCLSNGLTINASGKNGSGVLIVDVGGATIDVTAYQKLADDSFEEIAIPNRVIASFFEPSISCIVEAIKLQNRIAHSPIESVFLVGGFSANTWLFEKVQKAIEPLGIGVFRPDNHVWLIDEPEQYPIKCVIRADTSSVKREKVYSIIKDADYYQIDFDIVLIFGPTELKAQIAYLENGVEKRGPATIIYEEDDSDLATSGVEKKAPTTAIHEGDDPAKWSSEHRRLN
ncbi:hypothetical protein EST38_g138 [Candolleomyces aberdarensis]|uniref:Uncharacterized protein n=1 Tax=Candolleomyces aberdarensis TaxID=2316362 RepID=A0A4Q2E180_9AGAR|nr:hypothetical protein EST38_g138 [Candolleomyces aberdarensis]